MYHFLLTIYVLVFARKTNFQFRHSANPPVEMPVAWVLGRDDAPPPAPVGIAASSSQIPPAHPSVSLLQENSFVQNVSCVL